MAKLKELYKDAKFIAAVDELIARADMSNKEIAKQIGISNIALKRYMSSRQLKRPKARHDYLRLDKRDIKRVLDYWYKHGKAKTVEKFPELRVRSIIDRYGDRSYQRTLSDADIISIIKALAYVPANHGFVIDGRTKKVSETIFTKNRHLIKIKHRNHLWGLPAWKAKKICYIDRCTSYKRGNQNYYSWHEISKNIKHERHAKAVSIITKFGEWLNEA